MFKALFAALVIINIIALYYGAEHFLVDYSPSHIAGVCTPDALSKVDYESGQSMRNFLFPSMLWLVSATLLNLAFAGAVAFKKSSDSA
jgi:hypothetical protein